MPQFDIREVIEAWADANDIPLEVADIDIDVLLADSYEEMQDS